MARARLQISEKSAPRSSLRGITVIPYSLARAAYSGEFEKSAIPIWTTLFPERPASINLRTGEPLLIPSRRS